MSKSYLAEKEVPPTGRVPRGLAHDVDLEDEDDTDVDGRQRQHRDHPGGNCIKIGLPGKSILRDYFQENRTSRRPFLLQRISFPGRPIFIQLPPVDIGYKASVCPEGLVALHTS